MLRQNKIVLKNKADSYFFYRLLLILTNFMFHLCFGEIKIVSTTLHNKSNTHDSKTEQAEKIEIFNHQKSAKISNAQLISILP